MAAACGCVFYWLLMLPTNNAEQAIREFARQFFRLAAADRLAEACAMLDEPNEYGQVWTPAIITSVLHETFSPRTRFYLPHPEGPRFTSPDNLVEPANRFEVVPFADGSGYSYSYDVPLNGEWSDLTALFEFKQRPGGLAAILHDLHVL